MKKLIFIFFISFLVSSCSLKHDSKQQLKEDIIESIKNNNIDQILIFSKDANEYIGTISEFGDPEFSIDKMKVALNEGYLPLLEDISHGRFSCLKGKNILGKYKSTDWETRNIGFANWPTRAKGGILLEKIKLLNIQILIMRFLNEKELRPFIEQKQIDLNKAIAQIAELAKENNWVD